MTAQEWDSGASASALLRALERKKKLLPSPRKLQLFSVACLRCVPELVAHPWARPILDFAARLADEPLPDDEYRRTRTELFATITDHPGLWRFSLEGVFAIYERRPDLLYHRVAANIADSVTNARFTVAMLREVVGNPYRPAAVEPAWLTSDVLALARGIHDERAFDRMPILADALQDAGCTSDDVLKHCRDGRQMHIRGCWVVDLLLGKE
jgi:hypothetical protein